MKTPDCVKLNELRTIYYCKKLITLMLVVEELSRRIPDFENDRILTSKIELKMAEAAINNFLGREDCDEEKLFPLSWN